MAEKSHCVTNKTLSKVHRLAPKPFDYITTAPSIKKPHLPLMLLPLCSPASSTFRSLMIHCLEANELTHGRFFICQHCCLVAKPLLVIPLRDLVLIGSQL